MLRLYIVKESYIWCGIRSVFISIHSAQMCSLYILQTHTYIHTCISINIYIYLYAACMCVIYLCVIFKIKRVCIQGFSDGRWLCGMKRKSVTRHSEKYYVRVHVSVLWLRVSEVRQWNGPLCKWLVQTWSPLQQDTWTSITPPPEYLLKYTLLWRHRISEYVSHKLSKVSTKKEVKGQRSRSPRRKDVKHNWRSKKTETRTLW